ncbi:MAG: 50S ribosomal protein L24 [Lachnospiraceae bacterium]|nr:50S ribosomal protein L24 [Lachnospiraceae bacterium]
MAAQKIKKGDTVRVIAGKAATWVRGEKDKSAAEGKVIAVDKEKGRVTVEGLHKVTRHEKPSMRNQNGGRIQVEAPIDLSNVMLIHKGKPTRVGFKIQDGKKYRYAKATGEIIDDLNKPINRVREAK